MEFEFGWVSWFAFGWFIGGLVNGITGFGAAMAAMPFVLQGLAIEVAIPACSLMVLVASLEQGVRYRNFSDWSRISPVIAGALPGGVAGALVWHWLPPDYLRLFLGVFLLLYAAWGGFSKAGRVVVVNRIWGYVAGFLSAAFGSAFSFNGPPLAVYASVSGWGKLAAKAGLAMCFIVTCLIMVTAQIFAGLHSWQTFGAMLAGTPCSLLGAALGFRLVKNIGDRGYRRLLFIFIGATGVLFVAQAFKVLFQVQA